MLGNESLLLFGCVVTGHVLITTEANRRLRFVKDYARIGEAMGTACRCDRPKPRINGVYTELG